MFRLGLIVGTVGLLTVGCDSSPRNQGNASRNKGVAEASAAIAKGVLLLKEYPPLPSPAQHGEFIKLLKEKCNCDYQVIDAPKFSEELRDEVAGWNDTMKMELRRRFGATIIEDLQEEAQKRWNARIQMKDKK
jgi:hypothetical protein